MQILQELPRSEASARVLRAMFSARKRVFVDLLKWDVPVLAGQYEIDQFDNPDATYLILAKHSGGHRASARLLPTTKSHILADLFPQLSAGPVPSDSAVREITRFCIDPALPRCERRIARNQLVTALVDYALASNLTAYTAVANEAWYRQISRFGWDCHTLGPSQRIGDETLIAMKIAIDTKTPTQLGATGIYETDAFAVDTIAGTRQ